MLSKKGIVLALLVTLTGRAEADVSVFSNAWDCVKNFFTCDDCSSTENKKDTAAGTSSEEQYCKRRRAIAIGIGAPTALAAAFAVFLFLQHRKQQSFYVPVGSAIPVPR